MVGMQEDSASMWSRQRVLYFLGFSWELLFGRAYLRFWQRYSVEEIQTRNFYRKYLESTFKAFSGFTPTYGDAGDSPGVVAGPKWSSGFWEEPGKTISTSVPVFGH